MFVVLDPGFTYRLLHNKQITLRLISSFLKTCHTSLIVVVLSKTKTVLTFFEAEENIFKKIINFNQNSGTYYNFCL